MEKVPSVKLLLLGILLTAVTFLTYSNIGLGQLLNVAEEYRFKAEKLQSEGKLDQAIECYQKAIGMDKLSAAAHNGLAICYEKQGRLKQAEEEYLQALEINPKYAPSHYNLGLFYEKYGDIEQAIFHWTQRIRLGHPGDPGRIKAELKLKKYAPEELKKEDARELSQEVVQGKEEKALDSILGRKKYTTKQELIQDYYLEGMEFYQRGDFRKAAESFQKMIDTLPLFN